jgi:hypothetical protein
MSSAPAKVRALAALPSGRLRRHIGNSSSPRRLRTEFISPAHLRRFRARGQIISHHWSFDGSKSQLVPRPGRSLLAVEPPSHVSAAPRLCPAANGRNVPSRSKVTALTTASWRSRLSSLLACARTCAVLHNHQPTRFRRPGIKLGLVQQRLVASPWPAAQAITLGQAILAASDGHACRCTPS